MIKSIAFDIDGVLVDDMRWHIKDFLTYYKSKHNGNAYLGKIDMTGYYYKDRFPDVSEEEIQTWLGENRMRYYETVPFRPYVKELFQTLKKMNIEIHIITARSIYSKEHPERDIEKEREITKQRFLKEGIPVDQFHIGLNEKLSIMKGNKIELIVEDSPEQAFEISESLPVFLMDCPYNQLVHGRNIWRIHTLEPKSFINDIKYMLENLDTWETEYVLQESGPLIPFNLDKGNIIYNPGSIKKKNIIFVVPMGNSYDVSSMSTYVQDLKNSILLRLSLIGDISMDSSDPRYETGDAIIRMMVRKINRKKIDLMGDPASTEIYRIYCAVLEELLRYAKEHPKKSFIIDGPEIMMLPRPVLKKYAEYPVILANTTKREQEVAVQSMYKKDYNPFLVLEDLSEVATQLRKWRIIAGTTKNQITKYINRQSTTSDGVDYVALLPDEVPWNSNLINSIVSRDTFLFCDPHLATDKPEKLKRMIRSINKRVSRNDHLICLGDTDGKKGKGDKRLIRKLLESINTKNVYLILGNNDPYSIETYARLGFKSVVDGVIFQESPASRIILTHCPVEVSNDDINIHGHIHGSRCYWNVDWKNHYDVWDEDYTPITIGECLKILEKNMYKARTELHKVY